MLPYKNRLNVVDIGYYLQFPKAYARVLKSYAKHVDARLEDFIWLRMMSSVEKSLIRKHCFKSAMWCFAIRNFIKHKVLHQDVDKNRLSITK